MDVEAPLRLLHRLSPFKFRVMLHSHTVVSSKWIPRLDVTIEEAISRLTIENVGAFGR